jgi:EmrB/QacA subfamily drug resistance transporter
VRSGATAGGASYPLLLATVGLGSVFAPLNSTMLAVALPGIRDDFSVGIADIGWLISAYLIAMAVAQPVGGRLGDQLGRATVFRLGLLGFLGFSIAAALSPTFPALVALRTGQALCGAAVMPNAMAMLRESVPVSRLGRSTGFIGSTTSIAAGVGPLLGAVLLAAGSWRLLFFINAPLVVLALASLYLLRYPAATTKLRFSLDWFGSATFATALVALTYLLNSLRGGTKAYLLTAAAALLVLSGAAFVRRQLLSPTPMAEWSLFRNRTYAGATAFILLSNLVMYTTLLSIPFFVEEVQGKGSATTGTLLGAMSLLMAVLAPMSGRFSDTYGRRLPGIVGALICLFAVIALLIGLNEDVPYLYLAACLASLGLGIGLSFSPAGTAAIESAPREMAGAAAGTNSMMRYIGSIVGAGMLGAVLTSNGAAPGIDVFRLMFGVLIAMAALAVASVSLIHRFPSKREGAALDQARIVPVSGGR